MVADPDDDGVLGEASDVAGPATGLIAAMDFPFCLLSQVNPFIPGCAEVVGYEDQVTLDLLRLVRG